MGLGRQSATTVEKTVSARCWLRGLNENTHGLLRQYFPKGSDLSGFSQADLNAVAWQLNTLPRKSLGFKYPAELFMPESFGFFKHHHQFVALPT